jgi:putative endonuclease
MKRRRAEQQGRDAEARAAMWLRLGGWRILETRKKTKLGEIDLIARKGRLVSFVEVKWRKRQSDLDFAIDERRLSRVAAAAEMIAHLYLHPGDDMRIDVILLAPGHLPRHITNAWMP